MKHLALTAPLVLVLTAACASGKPPPELTREAACLQHFENDPIGRDSCRRSGERSGERVQDVRPQDLPIRTGEPSG